MGTENLETEQKEERSQPLKLKLPNQETLEALADIENKRNLTRHDNSHAMFDSWDRKPK